jgi:DNA-3-methyladenine glycosylase II
MTLLHPTLGKPAYWPEACAALAAEDPVMAALIASYDGEFLQSRGDAFYTLARAIVGQQISVKAADSVWARFEALVGVVEPGRVIAQAEEALRSVGFSRQKVTYMHDLARHFLNGEVHPDRWHAMDDEEIIRELTAIRGIGRWTVEMFLIFTLMRPDVFPLADIGMLKAVERHYFEGQKTPPSVIRQFGERWRPWRTVATWYLWRALDPVPVAY